MKRDTLKSLRKSLEILNLFLSPSHELSMGEIIKLSKSSQSTVSRIVSVLVEYKYLKRGEEGKYSPGTIYLLFSRIFKNKMEIRKIAVPYLLKLSRQLNEPSVLAFHNGYNDLLVERFSDSLITENVLTVSSSQTAKIIPLHCTAPGKLALAYSPNSDIHNYCNTDVFKKYTPKTITAENKLKNQLNTIKKTGVALENEEYEIGVRGIATVIRDSEDEVIGSISVVVPTPRYTYKQLKDLEPVIKSYALDISKELGYMGQ